MKIPESGRILISRGVNTIEHPSHLEKVLIDRESTAELDQTNDSQEMDLRLAAPAEKLAPADPNQNDPDLAFKPQHKQNDLTYFPNSRRFTLDDLEPNRSDRTVKENVGTDVSLDNPLSFMKTICWSDHHNRREAMKEDIKSIYQKVFCSLVDVPAGGNLIATRWIYQTKTKANSIIERHNARLVAKRFSQKAEIDFLQIYAVVMKYSTLRLVLSLAVQRQLKML